ncbi:MAG TPA: hypothetical protein VGN09_29240 [Vicinamibacteria bacterium]
MAPLSEARPPDPAARAAIVCAAAMVAQQVAGKAARDALFLTGFPVAALPTMVAAAAGVSLLAAAAATPVLAAAGPGAVLPAAFAASSALQLCVFAGLARAPRGSAVALYLLMAALGPVLASAFWSVVAERFDPRSAKRWVARIAAGGTLGGLAGGVLAERTAAAFGIAAVLPLLAGLHALCAWRVRAVVPPSPVAPQPEAGESVDSGPQASGYLRVIGAFVLAGSAAATLLDFAFKREAVATIGTGPQLLRFFAGFYTACALAAFAMQVLLARHSLERLGLARTIALLPAAVVLGGAAVVAAPRMLTIAGLRALESVLRSSLYRAGYELLYTPVPSVARRGAKTAIDVGLDRLGEMAGAALLRLSWVSSALPSVVAVATGLGVAGLALTRALHRGYVRALERSLLSRAVALRLEDAIDATTRRTLETTSFAPRGAETPAPSLPLPRGTDSLETGLVLLTWTAQAARPEPARAARAEPAPPSILDPLDARWADLRSRDAARVGAALAAGPLDPLLAPQAVRLLAWDAVAAPAAEALRPLAARIAGQLVDTLLDPDEEFAIRRRIPRLLAAAGTDRAAQGLLRGLEDGRFDVRFECARALARLRESQPAIVLPPGAVFEALGREAAVGRELWESRRVPEPAEGASASPLERLLARRGNRSLEHVFTLLSLVLPPRPVRLALFGLLAEDDGLRGTALEYLDTVLPGDLRAALWPFLDAAPPPQSGRTTDEVLHELLQSEATVELALGGRRP